MDWVDQLVNWSVGVTLAAIMGQDRACNQCGINNDDCKTVINKTSMLEDKYCCNLIQVNVFGYHKIYFWKWKSINIMKIKFDLHKCKSFMMNCSG